jgi:cytochrome b561
MARIDPVRAAAARYDTATIALHWTTAILVGMLWIVGQTIDFWPRGPLRVDYRSSHVLLGTLLGVVIVVRLIWRATGGRRFADVEGPRVMAIAARAVHWTLYVLVSAVIVLGLLTAFAQGLNIFGLFSLPSFAPGNRNLAHTLFDLHSLGANAVLIIAGLHAAAALAHHYLLRDPTLRRMLPRRFAN